MIESLPDLGKSCHTNSSTSLQKSEEAEENGDFEGCEKEYMKEGTKNNGISTMHRTILLSIQQIQDQNNRK
jgi:hypothetical protein